MFIGSGVAVTDGCVAAVESFVLFIFFHDIITKYKPISIFFGQVVASHVIRLLIRNMNLLQYQ